MDGKLRLVYRSQVGAVPRAREMFPLATRTRVYTYSTVYCRLITYGSYVSLRAPPTHEIIKTYTPRVHSAFFMNV